MEKSFNEDLCLQKHEEIKSSLAHHEKWLQDHELTITELVKENSKFNERFLNLIQKIDSLTKVLWWIVGIMVSSLLGFFFYAIQNHLFKGGI